MSNQYGTVTPVYEKCSLPTCNNTVRRLPHHMKKSQNRFCSKKCSNKSLTAARKYTDDQVQWIIDNNGKLTREEMITHFKTNRTSFQKALSVLRSKGHKIPRLNPHTGNRKSILTDTQKSWIRANFNSMSWVEMEAAMNVKRSTIKSYIDYQLKTKAVTRIPKERTKFIYMPKKAVVRIPKEKPIPVPKPQKVVSKSDGRSNRNTPGNTAHRDRKPLVEGVKSKDIRLPTRKIDTSNCIVVRFNDKNKSQFTARDEEHAERIREKYAYLEKPFGAGLRP